MAIKIRKDGVVQDLVINANEVRVLDKDGNFRSKNLETVLKELNMNGGSGGGTGTGGSGYPKDAEYVYVKDSEPDMDGVWFDESDVSSQPIVGDNSVVKAIREYIDTDVKAIVDKNDKIVQDIKEKVGDKLDVVSQLSNPNLLINGDFRNPINQRGKTQYTSNEYCVDRWTKWNNTFTTSIQDGFLQNRGTWITLLQYIEGCQKIFKRGTVFTMSAKVKCEKNRGVTFSYYDHTANRSIGERCPEIAVGTDWKIIKHTVTVNVDTVNPNTAFCIEASWSDTDTAALDIEWIKLELGSVATPFVPRPYAEELALCQRYYECSTHTSRGLIGSDLLRLSFDVQYKQTKRIVPTLKFYGLNNEEGVVMGKIDSNPPTNFPIQVHANNTDGFGCLDIMDRKGQSFITGETFEMRGWEADAEIY